MRYKQIYKLYCPTIECLGLQWACSDLVFCILGHCCRPNVQYILYWTDSILGAFVRDCQWLIKAATSPPPPSLINYIKLSLPVNLAGTMGDWYLRIKAFPIIFVYNSGWLWARVPFELINSIISVCKGEGVKAVCSQQWTKWWNQRNCAILTTLQEITAAPLM